MPDRPSALSKSRTPTATTAGASTRIISLNLNGIRSAAKKGVFEWLATQHADIICVQELKAQEADMAAHFLANATHAGWFHYAEKKGYSGAGLYARDKPAAMQIGFSSKEFDGEGRYVRADFDRATASGVEKLSVISLYLPSGSSSPERQEAKFRFLAEFLPHLVALKAESEATGREFVLCGDWNIAHREIDLKNWRSNQKNSGFLPEERAWLTRVFDELGWVDVYRRLHPETTGEAYTWWSTVARPGPTTSDGASTIRSPRPASRQRRCMRRCSRTRASRITRR